MKKSINVGKLLVIPYDSYSNYVNLPEKALGRLAKLKNYNNQYFFELKTPSGTINFVGIKEFTNMEGCIETPIWLADTMASDYVYVTLLKDVPKGKFVKMEPQEKDFFEIPDNDTIMERELAKYCLLSLNEVIPVKILEKIYKFKIIEIKTPDMTPSDLIDIVNVDLEVDFFNKFLEPETETETGKKTIPETIPETISEPQSKPIQEPETFPDEMLAGILKEPIEEKNKDKDKEKGKESVETLRELRLKYYQKKNIEM
jgi:ubiquitin fusion degradation protein 1